jgi:hypothetical protein
MYNLCDLGHVMRIRELNEFISYVLKNLPDELVKDAQDEIEWIENMLEEKEENRCRETSCDETNDWDD